MCNPSRQRQRQGHPGASWLLQHQLRKDLASKEVTSIPFLRMRAEVALWALCKRTHKHVNTHDTHIHTYTHDTHKPLHKSLQCQHQKGRSKKVRSTRLVSATHKSGVRLGYIISRRLTGRGMGVGNSRWGGHASRGQGSLILNQAAKTSHLRQALLGLGSQLYSRNPLRLCPSFKV